jgi:hypothetical protein
LRQGSIVFARTLDVESGLGRDYYLLEIDTTTGAPFRTVKLGKDGWIQADAPWNGHPRRVTALDLQVVAQQLREKHGAVNALCLANILRAAGERCASTPAAKVMSAHQRGG